VPPDTFGPHSVWHEDVEVWAFWDQIDDGAFLGFLYFDLFQRQDKSPGIFNVTMQPVCIFSKLIAL
jgi:metallopeptidase MepB